MFILYAIAIGLIVGLIVGGRLAGLADLTLRWPWMMVVGLLVQVALFSTPVTDRIGALGPPIYVASTALVLAAIWMNRRIPGMLIVAIGAGCNLSAIVANGGFMPADPATMAALGKGDPTTYSNSAILADPALRPLTDIFVLPEWLPFANVFSVGDILIGLGVAVVIVVAMRRRRPRRASRPAIRRSRRWPQPMAGTVRGCTDPNTSPRQYPRAMWPLGDRP
jgi:Family of unknown function (DUF5317)